MSSPERVSKTRGIYIRISNLVRGMAPGDRLPSYRELKKRLHTQQRPLDLAYDQLEKDGAVVRRHGDGTYVVDPWAGGLFVCLLSSRYMTSEQGLNTRLFYQAMVNLLHARHPETDVFLVTTTEQTKVQAEREEQVRERLPILYHRARLLGVFSTYILHEERTRTLFRRLNLPHVSISPGKGWPHVLLVQPRDFLGQGLRHLLDQGWRDILVLGLSREPDADGVIKNVSASYAPRARVRLHFLEQDEADWHSTEAACLQFGHVLAGTLPLPDAILFLDDVVCRFVLLGAYFAGVQLAERCAIVTLANKGSPIYATRPLTCLEYDYDLVAAEALRMMESLHRGARDLAPRLTPLTLRLGRSSLRKDYPSTSPA